MTIPQARAEGADSFASAPPLGREVVALVLEHHGRIALFRRSARVDHDRGLWHCITGYVEPGAAPEQQALTELSEEAGLATADLSRLEYCGSLNLSGRRGDSWLVHAFKAVTSRRRLVLNYEHDTYRWTSRAKVRRFSNKVEWLQDVLEATLHSGSSRETDA